MFVSSVNASVAMSVITFPLESTRRYPDTETWNIEQHAKKNFATATKLYLSDDVRKVLTTEFNDS